MSKAVLVGTGSFRVDRKRALDKLMRFQLPDGAMFLLPWVQAAVAGEATRIGIETALTGLTMTFDGQPLTAEDLRDPYACLFDRALGWRGARGRGLAIGLLSGLRLTFAGITVKGKGGTLKVKSATEETFDASTGAEQGTVLLISGVGTDKAVAILRERGRWCPVPISIDGKAMETGKPDGPALEFRSGARGGQVWLAPRSKSTSIRLVSYGIELAELSKSLPLVQVAAVVRDDGLRTNLSQTAVVQDPRLKRDLALVTERARLLLRRSIEEARALAPEVGAWLAAPAGEAGFDALAHWMHWDGTLAALRGAFSGEPADERARKVRKLATLTMALRQACVARKDDLLGEKRGLADELWQAPVAFDVAGKPLSPRDLEALRRAIGHVPYSDRGRPPAVPNGTAAWAPKSSDANFLVDFYGAQARPILRGWGEDRIDAVSVLSGKLTVESSFRSGEARGTVGISYTPRAGSSRVRWLLRGKPPVLAQFDTGPLRLEAVLEHPGLLDPPKDGDAAGKACLADLLGAAPALYEALSRLYRHVEITPAQAVLRDHLLDFLAYDWDKASRAPKTQAWLSALKLFRVDDRGWLSLDELRAAGAGGERLVLLSPPHMPEQARLSRGRPDRVRELLGTAPWVKAVKTVQPRGKGGSEEASPAAGPAAPVAVSPESSFDADARLEALKPRLRRFAAASGEAVPASSIDELECRSSKSARAPLWRAGSGWCFNLSNPVSLCLLKAPDRELADAYLASVLFSAVNRESGRVSDAQDIELQLSIARGLI